MGSPNGSTGSSQRVSWSVIAIAIPSDRRATLIRLTAEGRALIDEALPLLLTMEGDSLDEVLTDRQADQVAASLRRLLVSLED